MRKPLVSAAFVFVLALAARPAQATPVTYSNNFSRYGQIENTACGQGGICAASAAENSFIYLKNQYPGKYGRTKIDVGNEVGAGAQGKAAVDFAINGWTANANNYLGYYRRPGSPTGDYIATLMDWTRSFAPNTSTFTSMFVGNAGTGANGSPNWAFLAPQIQSHEDVELFIAPVAGQGAHVITLTGVTIQDPTKGCGTANNCSITYQDSNNPSVNQNATLTLNNGVLGFFDATTFNANVNIYAAFSQSPIPEPATLALLGAGLLALGLARRKAGWPGGMVKR